MIHLILESLTFWYETQLRGNTQRVLSALLSANLQVVFAHQKFHLKKFLSSGAAQDQRLHWEIMSVRQTIHRYPHRKPGFYLFVFLFNSFNPFALESFKIERWDVVIIFLLEVIKFLPRSKSVIFFYRATGLRYLGLPRLVYFSRRDNSTILTFIKRTEVKIKNLKWTWRWKFKTSVCLTANCWAFIYFKIL